MAPNPSLGVVLHAIGGLASAVFYLPYRKVRHWAWASYWITGGIMSACMSYGFAAGKPIAALAVRHGASELWKNLPVLIVVLAGGFMTNFIWCVGLNLRKKTGGNYFQRETQTTASGNGAPRTVP